MAKLKGGTRIYGDVKIDGGIYDSANQIGIGGSVLISTGVGIAWTTANLGGGSQGTQGLQGLQGTQGLQGLQGTQGLQGVQGLQGLQGTQGLQGLQGASSAAGAGSGTFDTGISTSIYAPVTSGIGIGTVNTNNIFAGPGIAYSFPSTAGREYVIESIHVTNIFSNELYLSGRQDYFVSSNNWSAIPMTQRVVVPYQGAVELLEQPIIASPQDILRFQALSGVGTTAGGVDGGLDAFIVYSTKTDTTYIGTGKTVVSSTGTEIYTSTTNPTVVQSIRLVNYNLSIDIDASVSIYRGGTVGGIVTTGVRQGYLAYNLTVPKNSTIEICEKPKYLAVNDTIVAVGSTINSLAVHVAGKSIV